MNSKKFVSSVTSGLVLAATLLACAANSVPEPGGVTVTACKDRTSYGHFSGDESFTRDERLDWVSAGLNWSTFSNGRMGATFEWRAARDANEPHVFRVLSTDAVVQQHDADAAKVWNMPGFQYAGWSEDPQQIYLVVDRIGSRERFLADATHELGHALGLRWPDCPKVRGEDCFHTDDASALMCGVPRAKKCDFAKELGPGDLAFCRASCLCD